MKPYIIIDNFCDTSCKSVSLSGSNQSKLSNHFEKLKPLASQSLSTTISVFGNSETRDDKIKSEKQTKLSLSPRPKILSVALTVDENNSQPSPLDFYFHKPISSEWPEKKRPTRHDSIKIDTKDQQPVFDLTSNKNIINTSVFDLTSKPKNVNGFKIETKAVEPQINQPKIEKQPIFVTVDGFQTVKDSANDLKSNPEIENHLIRSAVSKTKVEHPIFHTKNVGKLIRHPVTNSNNETKFTHQPVHESKSIPERANHLVSNSNNVRQINKHVPTIRIETKPSAQPNNYLNIKNKREFSNFVNGGFFGTYKQSSDLDNLRKTRKNNAKILSYLLDYRKKRK